jgi:orotate phosphoribosyltransferase
MTALFQTGDFTLRSGQRSRWKIACDALTTDDWKTLAMMAAEILPPFGRVEAVPRGGLLFAISLNKYINPDSSVLLICEDVVTTGGSVERIRDGRDAIGVCVFARGPVPSWVTPLFQMGNRDGK